MRRFTISVNERKLPFVRVRVAAKACGWWRFVVRALVFCAFCVVGLCSMRLVSEMTMNVGDACMRCLRAHFSRCCSCLLPLPFLSPRNSTSQSSRHVFA